MSVASLFEPLVRASLDNSFQNRDRSRPHRTRPAWRHQHPAAPSGSGWRPRDPAIAISTRPTACALALARRPGWKRKRPATLTRCYGMSRNSQDVVRSPNFRDKKQRRREDRHAHRYDAAMGRLLVPRGQCTAGGELLGHGRHGLRDTIEVTLDARIHHTRAVSRESEGHWWWPTCTL